MDEWKGGEVEGRENRRGRMGEWRGKEGLVEGSVAFWGSVHFKILELRRKRRVLTFGISRRCGWWERGLLVWWVSGFVRGDYVPVKC